MKIKENKLITFGIYALVFLLLLLCNFMTEEIADDFSYHFSWSSGELIDSVADIFPSMKLHAEYTNGRLVAHFFVQLFEMLPKWIFNIVNSGFFVAMIALMYYVAADKKRNNFLLFTIFGAVWVFTPAFGQVYLWLDGACNYLWGVIFGLLYLIPFINDFLYDKPVKTIWMKIVLVIFALPMGSFSENGSAAFIFMSVLLQLALVFIQHKKFTVCGIASVVTSLVGFYLMVSAPGTAKNKGGDWSLGFLRENFITALETYKTLQILLIAFCIMLVLAFTTKVQKEKIYLSVIFFAGSLVSNFMMTAAAYYPPRSMIFCTILLIVADAILFERLLSGNYKTLMACAAAVLVLYTAFYVCIGVDDIYYTGSKLRENEAYIIACKEEGMTDIKVPLFFSDTKYSASNGLLYLSSDPTVWPNTSMAKYFGVNSIIGYWE